MSDQLIMANLLFERHVLHTSILIDVIFIILAELTIYFCDDVKIVGSSSLTFDVVVR